MAISGEISNVAVLKYEVRNMRDVIFDIFILYQMLLLGVLV